MIRIKNTSRYFAIGVCLCAVAGTMFAFVAKIGPKSCDCSQTTTSIAQSNCCETSQDSTPCCSAIAKASKLCCCNPDASECHCEGCSCNELQNSPLPAAPVPPNQQTVEFVFVGVVGQAAQFAAAWSDKESARPSIGYQLKDWPTSHEKCVMLSRFNC